MYMLSYIKEISANIKCCKLYFLNELMNEKAQNVEYIIEINDSNIIKKIKNDYKFKKACKELYR